MMMDFLGGSAVKNLLPTQERRPSTPGSGRSPEKEKATQSSILAWRIPWTEQPGRPQSIGSQSWTPLSDSHTHTLLRLEILCSLQSMASHGPSAESARGGPGQWSLPPKDAG